MDADLDGPRAADDASARVLLRRAGAIEERAQHDDDEFHLAGLRRRGRGRSSATRWHSHRQRWLGDLSNAFLNGVGLEAKGTIPARAVHGVPGHVRDHHRRADLGRDRRADAVLGLRRVHHALGARDLRPVAHWVWGGGWLAKMGALDFAGGTVVHVNAAAAALVAALVIGKRTDYGSSSILPHNVPFVLLGAGLLWFGWFGFNAGSALAASPQAGLAFVTTMLAPAATLVVWTILDAVRTGKPSSVGCATAIVVGLVAVTPAAGYISPMSALALGAIAAVPSYFGSCCAPRPRSTTRSMSSPRTASAARWARC